jgi:hypothetical protein
MNYYPPEVECGDELLDAPVLSGKTDATTSMSLFYRKAAVKP